MKFSGIHIILISLLAFYIPISHADKNDLANKHYQQGLNYLNQQKHELAVQSFTQAINLNPTLAMAFHSRGQAYAQMEQYEKAIEDYTTAGKWNVHLTDFDNLLKTARAGVTNKQGIEHLEIGRLQQAEHHFAMALNFDPNFARSYNNLGLIALERGQLAQERPSASPTPSTTYFLSAINLFNRAILLDTTLPAFYNNRGIAYSELKDWNKALKNYDKAIQMDLFYFSAYANRANVHSEQGHHEKAIQDLNTALKLSKKHAGKKKDSYYKGHSMVAIYNNRGRAYERSGQLQSAIADYHSALNDPYFASLPPASSSLRAKIIDGLRAFFYHPRWENEFTTRKIDPDPLRHKIQIIIQRNLRRAQTQKARNQLNPCRTLF